VDRTNHKLPITNYSPAVFLPKGSGPAGVSLTALIFPHPLSLYTLSMIAPETFNHIENIKKRAGHLWRFL
jgi:hypothetical protein